MQCLCSFVYEFSLFLHIFEFATFSFLQKPLSQLCTLPISSPVVERTSMYTYLNYFLYKWSWAKYIFVNHPLCTFACWQKGEGPKQSQSLVQLLPCRKVWIPKLLHYRNYRGQNNIFKKQSLTDLIFFKNTYKKKIFIYNPLKIIGDRKVERG